MELKSCCKIWKAFKDKSTGVIILEDKDGNRLHYCPSRINGCPTCLKAFEQGEKVKLPKDEVIDLNKFSCTEEIYNYFDYRINQIIRYLRAKETKGERLDSSGDSMPSDSI